MPPVPGSACSKGSLATDTLPEPKALSRSASSLKRTKSKGAMVSDLKEAKGDSLLDGYGDNMFRGKVAKAYLDAVGGIKLAELESGSWVRH